MNAGLIEGREQASDRLDADVIASGASVARCRHEGWPARE